MNNLDRLYALFEKFVGRPPFTRPPPPPMESKPPPPKEDTPVPDTNPHERFSDTDPSALAPVQGEAAAGDKKGDGPDYDKRT